MATPVVGKLPEQSIHTTVAVQTKKIDAGQGAEVSGISKSSERDSATIVAPVF